MFPEQHFPGTPPWVRCAVDDAIARAGVNAEKWRVPLEAIGFYESTYNPAANLCDEDKTLPIGICQQGRSFYIDAKQVDLGAHFGLGGFADPVRSFLMAISHIDSRLTVSGGYGGIGTLDGKVGLLPRTDRGPGNVLRLWVGDPTKFNRETARPAYRGY